RYEQLMSQASAISPVYYYSLGDFFATNSQAAAKAAKYYQKAMDLCSDSVRAANNSAWLVKYYEKNGQLQKASDVADRAAAVYSSLGLQTKADFLERQGRYEEAFQI